MEDKGSLLQLFDEAGLLPDLSYTTDSISKYKRKVSRLLARREPFHFKTSEGEEKVYAFNTFTDAIDRIAHIIERNGLVYYPMYAGWQSHWNPSATGEEWKQPMQEWETKISIFEYDRFKQTREVKEISDREHEACVLQSKTRAQMKELREELDGCHSRSDELSKDVESRDNIIEDLRRETARFRDQLKEVEAKKNQFSRRLKETEAEKTELLNTCHELQGERDRLQLELIQAKAAEEQRQRTIEEIDDIKDLAELRKESDHLCSLREVYESTSRGRRRRKEQLRKRMHTSRKNLEKAIEGAEKAESFLSLLEREIRVYEEMDIDGNEDENDDEVDDEDDDEVSSMEGPTEIGSNDSHGDIPCLSSDRERTRSGPQPCPKRRKKKDIDRCRVSLGRIENLDETKGIAEKVEVWAGIDKAGKIYRRCTPLGNGKTSVKHSEIEYLSKFQNLSQDAVDNLIKARVAATLQETETEDHP